MQHIKTSSKLIIQRGVRSLCVAGKINPAANDAEQPLSQNKRSKHVITSQKITLPLVRNVRAFSHSKQCMDLPQGREDATSLVTDIITEELKVPRDQITLATNFTDLGGNSTNIVTLVVKLRKAGFEKVQISDILNTKTVGDIVKAVAGESDSKEFDTQAEKQYKLHILDKSGDKDAIIDLTTKAYVQNNDVINSSATEEAIRLHLVENFDILVQDKLGCYYTNENGKIVACNITFDHEAEIVPTEGIDFLFEVLGTCKAFVDELIEKEKGRWAFVYSTVVEPGMDARDAAYLLEKMEDKAEELATEAGYDALYSLNMHSATLKYSEYQGAKGWFKAGEYSPHQVFKDKGGKNPFEHLPEDFFVNAVVKRIK